MPSDRPELNPAEQICQVLRARLANRVFVSLAKLEMAITEQPRAFWTEPASLKRLTAHP